MSARVLTQSISEQVNAISAGVLTAEDLATHTREEIETIRTTPPSVGRTGSGRHGAVAAGRSAQRPAAPARRIRGRQGSHRRRGPAHAGGLPVDPRRGRRDRCRLCDQTARPRNRGPGQDCHHRVRILLPRSDAKPARQRPHSWRFIERIGGRSGSWDHSAGTRHSNRGLADPPGVVLWRSGNGPRARIDQHGWDHRAQRIPRLAGTADALGRGLAHGLPRLQSGRQSGELPARHYHRIGLARKRTG